MHFFTSTSFFYTWHCNFPCEGPDFCAWSRVSIFWNLFRVEFWGRGLVRFFWFAHVPVGVGMWWRSLREHTWRMLRQHVAGLRLHTFRMLRKTWGWASWVGWGWGCDDVPCASRMLILASGTTHWTLRLAEAFASFGHARPWIQIQTGLSLTWKASTHDCEYRIMWESLEVKCDTSINHLMDTESEFSPWDLGKAHILLSTTQKAAKKTGCGCKKHKNVQVN